MDVPTFRVLAEALPEPLLLVDAEGRLVAASRDAEDLVPGLATAGPGTPLTELVTDDPARVRRMLRLCLGTGGALPGALTPRPAAGAASRRLQCRLVRSPTTDGGPRALVRLSSRTEGMHGFIDLNARVEEVSRAAHVRRRSHAEQASLHRVARAVAAAAAPDDVFDLVAEEVATLLEAEAGIVWRFEGLSSMAVGSWGDHLTVVGTRYPLRGEGALPRVWATGAPARAEYNAMPDDDPTRERVWRQGYHTGIAAPVRAGGRMWGAVLAASTRADVLPPGTEDRLGRFAELVGLAIANADDRRALSERIDEQAAIGRVATATASERPPDEILELVCREAARIAGAAVGGITQITGPGRGVIRATWSDGRVEALPPGTPVDLSPSIEWMTTSTARTVRTAPESRTTGGPPDDPAWRARWGEAVSSTIAIGGRPWGLLSVAALGSEPLPPVAEHRVTALAGHAGIAVASAESRRALTLGAAEQAALRRVATAVAADASPEAVVGLVCQEAAELLGGALGVVGRIDDRAVRVMASWTRGDRPAPPEGLAVRMSDGAVARGLAAGRPVRLTLGREDLGPWIEAYGEGVVAPIALHGRVWGLLAVLPEEGEDIDDGAEDRLLAFSRLIGVAVANAETRAAVADAAREQAALRRIATAVAAEPDLDAVFAVVSRETAELVGAPSAGVMRFIDDGHAQVVANWTAEGLPAPRTGAIEDMRARPEAVDAFARGATARFVPDDSDPAWLRGFADVAAALVVVGGEPWGVLGVAGMRPLPGDTGDRLARIAELAGLAVANDEVRRRSVDDAAALIAGGALDMGATLEAIAGAARRALYADRATCVLCGPDGTGIVEVHTTEPDVAVRAQIERSYRDGGAAGDLWDHIVSSPEATIAIEDVSAAAGLTAPPPAALAAYIVTRLEQDGRLLGGLIVGYDTPRRVGARDRAAIRSLASVAELAVANARMHERTLDDLAEAEERAATDPLTGLANHRAFHERLRAEAERAVRHRRRLSLAIFDLDHFKDVNDRHGHQAGDAVLVEVAQRIAAQARPEDLVARLGGEEFAWLLPESDSLDAWQAAERAREAVRGAAFALGERCTMSAGVAELSQARDAGDLVRLADGALYWAKEHGRDVAFRYSPEVVEELSAQERAERLERSQALNAIRVLARAVDAKDPSTRRHSERVAALADALAAELGWPPERRALLRGAGLVHDVGKIGVPDSILFKPERLTSGEYGQVKQHARLGAQIVADALSAEQVGWVRAHHERVDGGGYPDGLRGEQIPDGARVLAVADAWDVMTSDRPYAPPVPPEAALAECRRHAGAQFDAAVVAALERLVGAGALPAPTAL